MATPGPTFGDDRKTGAWDASLRGQRRATILARAEDGDGFSWLASFKHDYLPVGTEAKGSVVLPILDANPLLFRQVMQRIEPYAIVIIDLQAYRDELVAGIAARMSPVIPPGADPVQFVLGVRYRDSQPQQILRSFILQRSVLGKLEDLLGWVGQPFGIKLDDDPDVSIGEGIDLTKHPALEELSDTQLALLLGKIAIAVGDALDPARQASAIEAYIEREALFGRGSFALHTILPEVRRDRIFDEGPRPVARALQDTHTDITTYLRRNMDTRLHRLTTPGRIEEHPSHQLLGLEAADIAATVATREYERHTDRAHAVKQLFPRVFLNHTWI